MMSWKKYLRSGIAALLLIGIGYGAGYLHTDEYTKNLIKNIKPVRENNFNYKFIFPLLRYDFGNARTYLEDKTLEQKLNTYVENEYSNKAAGSISIYVSDLLDNSWAGVNQDIQYHPGSMMKVMIMMAYFRESQLDPRIMTQYLTYTKQVSDAVKMINYSTPSNLTIGGSYTIQNLVENMIENSDNGAETLLVANANQKILNDIYHDLNIRVPTEVPDFTISTRSYSAFIRILYNSTYLIETNSEEALSILSKTSFKSALVAGVPSDIVVAHKYGERVDTDANGTVTAVELHDCGIVYAENPYQICVMTRGSSEKSQQDLAAVIKDISTIAYNYANSKSQ